MRRRHLLLPVLLLLSPYAASAQDARIDSIFAPWDRAGFPGCAVGVVQNGALVFQKGYGYANLDYGLRNGPEMTYYVGSVSKQFTAAAIALLAQEGRIGLDDDVRRYIPELPDYGETMTIRQLVHHTSGLRDIYTLMNLAGIRLEDVLTDAEAVALIARQRELNFAPGSQHLYSNSGYFLLGQIVRRVTGQSLREYADARIFQPLGMTSTHFHDQPNTIVPNRAISYGGSGGDFRITYLGNFDKIGAGGLYTTLADLARWDANFYDPKVGGAEFLTTMHTRGVLDNGDTLAYAFGLTLGEHRGLPIVRHGGALMGFRADLVRYPAQRTTIVTLCNHGSIDPGALADRVAGVYLGEHMSAPRPPAPAAPSARPAPPAASADGLAAYPGRYFSEELAAAYDVALAGDTLRLTRRLYDTQPLRPAGGERFSAGNSGHVLVFQRDGAGRVTGFTVQAGRVQNIRFVRQR